MSCRRWLKDDVEGKPLKKLNSSSFSIAYCTEINDCGRVQRGKASVKTFQWGGFGSCVLVESRSSGLASAWDPLDRFSW
jgi:hypothetical protein